MKYCSILRSRHKNCIHVNHMEFTNYEVEDLKVGGFEYERGTWHKYVIAPSNSTTQHPLKQLKVHKYKKLYMYGCSYMATFMNSGKRTEWSPILSVIIRSVITKSDDRKVGVQFVIMSMIAD